MAAMHRQVLVHSHSQCEEQARQNEPLYEMKTNDFVGIGKDIMQGSGIWIAFNE